MTEPAAPPRPSAAIPAEVAAIVTALAQGELVAGLYDAQDRLCWCNPRFERLFLRGMGLPVPFADLLRQGHAHGYGVKIDSGDIEAFLADVLPRRRSQAWREFQTDLIDGTWVWMTETVLPDGWLLSVATDITALKRDERSLRRARDEALLASRTDVLTGAANRRHVLESAERLLDELRAAGRPMSVSLIDLDHFKRLNDTHGHLAGDEALRRFHERARAHLRPQDLIGRYGGEEFLLVLPDTSLETATAIVERLRARGPVDAGNSTTFSAGVTDVGPDDGMVAVLRRADQALYDAKRLGRDRVVMRSSSEAPDGTGLPTSATLADPHRNPDAA